MIMILFDITNLYIWLCFWESTLTVCKLELYHFSGTNHAADLFQEEADSDPCPAKVWIDFNPNWGTHKQAAGTWMDGWMRTSVHGSDPSVVMQEEEKEKLVYQLAAHLSGIGSRQRESRPCWMCPQRPRHNRCTDAWWVMTMKVTMTMTIAHPSTFLYSAKWDSLQLLHQPYNTSLKWKLVSFAIIISIILDSPLECHL